MTTRLIPGRSYYLNHNKVQEFIAHDSHNKKLVDSMYENGWVFSVQEAAKDSRHYNDDGFIHGMYLEFENGEMLPDGIEGVTEAKYFEEYGFKVGLTYIVKDLAQFVRKSAINKGFERAIGGGMFKVLSVQNGKTLILERSHDKRKVSFAITQSEFKYFSCIDAISTMPPVQPIESNKIEIAPMKVSGTINISVDDEKTRLLAIEFLSKLVFSDANV